MVIWADQKLNEYPVIWRTNRQKSLSSTSSSSDMNDNVHDFMFLFSFSIQGLSYFFEPPILVRENIGGFPANFLYLTYIMPFTVIQHSILFDRDGYKTFFTTQPAGERWIQKPAPPSDGLPPITKSRPSKRLAASSSGGQVGNS